MMRRVFDELGYRRYEWKCDRWNLPSRAAAARLGFTYEGLFRQAIVVRGRNRDTMYFSIIDREWPRLKTAFERWLDPAISTLRAGKKRAWRAFGNLRLPCRRRPGPIYPSHEQLKHGPQPSPG